MAAIRVILFDADGVIQRPTDALGVRLRRVMDQVPDGLPNDLDRFHADVGVAERPCLVDQADFVLNMRDVLARWGVPHASDEFIGSWFSIVPEPSLIQVVGRLRASGVACVIASNQERNRARHMAEQLDYAQVFDDQFYSCDLGVAKPNPQYFEMILERLSLAPADALFIDDRPANVDSARQVGLHGATFALSEVDDPERAMLALLREFGIRLD